jgi:integrase
MTLAPRACLRLVLLTGVRPGEAAFLNIGEKDRVGWIIPASRSKNGRSHLVPLSEMARQLSFQLELTGEDDEVPFPPVP